MEELNNIIGYEDVKEELRRLCDIMLNPDKYHKLGAKLPRGVLISGEPGIGKTLMATSLIKASKRASFVCRKTKTDGDFLQTIRETFSKAARNQPSIILFDDMDKFSNESDPFSNTDEFSTIQSCIDDYKDYDILVIATANSDIVFPRSLVREGRLEMHLHIQQPQSEDAKKIIKYYLDQKQYVSDLDIEEIVRILNGSTCAELENIINEAGLYAGYANKEKIEMEDFLKAYIRKSYKAPSKLEMSKSKYANIVAYHEAGHAVVAELLEPGSVAIISIDNSNGDVGGFTSFYSCNDYWNDKTYMENKIITLLAGKACTELKTGKVDVGASDDIRRAFRIAKRLVGEYCTYSFEESAIAYDASPEFAQKQTTRVSHELDRYMARTKELLSNNIHLVDSIANKLMQTKMLTHKQIMEIISSSNKENAEVC